MLTGAAIVVAAAAAFWLGRRRGAVSFWRHLLENRQSGHMALEQLAAAHRAKVELVELP